MGCAEESFPGCLFCFRIFINMMTIAAFILSLYTVDSCQFFDYSVNGDNDIPPFGGGPLEPEGSIGLFQFRNYEENCMDYPVTDFDVAMKTARVGAVIGVAGGGLALICTITEALICAMGMMCTIPTAFFMVCALLGQCLAYAIFGTERVCDVSSCSFGQGATLNTAAFSLYFCACFLVCIGPTGDSLMGKVKKMRKARKAEAEKEKEIEEVERVSLDEVGDEEEPPEGETPAQDPPGEKTTTASASVTNK